jgi:DNA polymerase-3 subunit delta
MTEQQLINELKQGVIRRIYFLHGKEPFLVQAFAVRILNKCLPEESSGDFNSVRLTGNPDLSVLAESVETLPVFADKRVVLLNDLDVERLDKDSLSALLTIFGSIPEETCVIIYLTGIEADLKKVKTKKLTDVIGKHGAVIGFDKLAKIDEAIAKRAGMSGCNISRENALHLAALCLNNYTLIISELDKLCGYAGYSGEITRESIELLSFRQLDSSVFALAGEITAKRGANALKLLNELIEQGNPPVVIMSSLSMTFIDFYRAKLGVMSSKPAAQIAKDFGYAPNRVFAVGKAITAVQRMSVDKTRECVRVLCDADYRLKSSPVNDRTIMERAVVELLTLC